MKTPKRNKGNGFPADYFPYDGPNQTAFEHARWKRKNRIAQLKRTIARLKKERNAAESKLSQAMFEATVIRNSLKELEKEIHKVAKSCKLRIDSMLLFIEDDTP